MNALSKVRDFPLPASSADTAVAAPVTVAHGDGIGPEIMKASQIGRAHV